MNKPNTEATNKIKLLTESEAWTAIAEAKIRGWHLMTKGLEVDFGNDNMPWSQGLCDLIEQAPVSVKTKNKMKRRIKTHWNMKQINKGYLWPLTHTGQLERKRFAKKCAEQARKEEKS